jgi:hypothetical protein
MQSEFLERRGQKIFQNNFASSFSPQQLLSTAAGAISQLTNSETGRKVWNVSPRPLPLAQTRGGLYVFATAPYQIAKLGQSVGLTLGVVPEGDLGTQFLAVFEDSMGWETGVSESIADGAAMTFSGALDSHHSANGGWRMTKGAWNFGHYFDAPPGVPPPPPAQAEQQTYMPEDFFFNPMTARVFGCTVNGIDASELVAFIGRCMGVSWNVEYGQEMEDGFMTPTFIGHTILSSQQVLYAFVFARPLNGSLWLSVQFADSGYWSSPVMQDALNRAVNDLQAKLQGSLPAARLELLPPPT